MDYEWDKGKARTNLRKHGVDFADAVGVLEDDVDPDEERFITVGMDALGRTLVVVYTFRDDQIRIISARKATTRERKRYEGDR